MISSKDRFTKVLFTVAASLICSGVVGLWIMSSQVSGLTERVKGLDERIAVWMKMNTDRVDYATKQIDQIARDQRDTDRRVGVIEGRTPRSN